MGRDNNETQGDPGAPSGDTREVEREARTLSHEMVKLEVRRRFAQIDGETHEVEEAVREIRELRDRRQALLTGTDEPQETRYQIARWEEYCLESERDRILDQMSERIGKRREATAKGETERASELTREIIALRQRRSSVYALFYGAAEPT